MAIMKCILLVEDEKDQAEITQVILEKAGYVVHLAYDGEEGLNKAKTINPDLIVLDLKLPKIDGYRVCELLKTDEKYKHIPIIMLTVRQEEFEKKTGFAAGANAYLVKPYESKVLLSKIKQLLKE